MGMDVYGKFPSSESGKYFRANVWSWRPIHALCSVVLGKPLKEWAYNDGKGFDNQKECDELAAKLEKYLTNFPNEEISVKSKTRVDPVTNRFLPPGSNGGISPYSTDHEHVRKFITFLRASGGFEIW